MTRRRAHGRGVARPGARAFSWCVALVGLLVLSACTSTAAPASPGPQQDLAAFVAALQSSRTDAASALTSEPGVARQALDSVILDNLEPKKLQLTTGALDWDGEATTATVAMTYRWTLPDVGPWQYSTEWTLKRRGAGPGAHWFIAWDPAVIHPQLGAQQSIVVRTVEASDGVVVDRNDRQLVTAQRVYAVQAAPRKISDPAGVATALVKLLRKYDPTLTAAGIVQGIADADPTIGYTVTNLRDTEFEAVATQLTKMSGLTFPAQVRNLGPTKDFARALLAQLGPTTATLIRGTPGWKIVAIDATGAEAAVLAERAAGRGGKVILTIDRDVQLAAERALAGITEPAVIVAIQPSTGEILAVAQNAAADAEGPIALTGSFPPGSIFKIVTATAAIDTQRATPQTVVECPGTWTINERPIRNEYEFDLGRVPLELAFAKSCNTTFAQLASTMGAGTLTSSAKQYGIGLDFVIPGITTLTGSVPEATDEVQRAEDGFGQGQVLVTPFSAALMAATAATGTMPVPTLIRGQRTKVDQKVPARSAAARSGVADLMAAVVDVGTAQNLKVVGTTAAFVHAKTGTAEYTDAKGTLKAHAWTVGYRGDLAFSALIVGGDSSKRTNVVLQKFLGAVK
ncbi:MAG: penicillin-binding transpeptidase domain-containing protein [Nakamurella sp.]